MQGGWETSLHCKWQSVLSNCRNWPEATGFVFPGMGWILTLLLTCTPVPLNARIPIGAAWNPPTDCWKHRRQPSPREAQTFILEPLASRASELSHTESLSSPSEPRSSPLPSTSALGRKWLFSWAYLVLFSLKFAMYLAPQILKYKI